jgi:hypothetical protein
MPKKLGVYRVGDLQVHSKLEAIDLHTRTGIHPHWDFGEDVFGAQDWTKEPTAHLLELYRDRAIQLRNQYDYIILMFSGGADSTNVLQAFVDNDIKLDELACYVNVGATKDRDSQCNAEIFRVAIPGYQHLQDKCPWIKLRLVDLSEFVESEFSKKNRFDWIYQMNMFFTPNNVARDSLGLKIKEWKNMIDAGKKLCILWGHDKPRMLHENNRYSFRFLDLIDNGPTVTSIRGVLPYTDELFYWTPDMPEIVIKQAHLIKNYLERHWQDSVFVSNQRSDLAYKKIKNKKYWLSNHGVHHIIYPKWNISTFTVGKPGSIIFSPRDTWFFNLEEDNISKIIWKQGMQKVWQMLPDYWKNDPSDMYHGLKCCWSRDYFLEP